jgi:hypothetical protein
MKDNDYENRSLTEAYRHMRDVEEAPLKDRKDAQKEFLDAMRTDPAIIAERLGWLFDGNYGYGEMMKARQILTMRGNANKAASLNQLVGAYEWRCPPAMTVAAWKKLSASEKNLLDRAIKIVIEEATKELHEDT